MLIISAGVQKSGSALLFNLLNDLLSRHGGSDIRIIREKYKLDDILLYHNCLLSELTWKTLKRVSFLSLYKTFVIKTHTAPTPLIRKFLSLGLLKLVLIVRDPRDIVLSAMDHGRKIKQAGEAHTFASCDSINNTLPQVKNWVNDAAQWLSCKNIIVVKYEDLMSAPIPEVFRIARYLNIKMDIKVVEMVLAGYQPANLGVKEQEFLHYNKAKVKRYRTDLSTSELEAVNNFLKEEIRLFSYQD